MPTRRAALAAVATALSGCARPSPPASPTASPAPTPSPRPYPADAAEAFGESSFDATMACPAGIPCFHDVTRGDRPEVVVVPRPERISPTQPRTTTAAYNFGDEELVLAAAPAVYKWTGIQWAPTIPFHGTTDVHILDPWTSLERTFRYDARGDGVYAVVERGGFGGPRGTVGMTVDGSFGSDDDRRRFGALFAVSGSPWQLTSFGLPTARDGGTLVVAPDRPASTPVVLAASDESTGIPVVPETIAAHPLTADAVLALDRESVERVRVPVGDLVRRYLESGLLFPADVTPARTLAVGEIRFTVRDA